MPKKFKIVRTFSLQLCLWLSPFFLVAQDNQATTNIDNSPALKRSKVGDTLKVGDTFKVSPTFGLSATLMPRQNNYQLLKEDFELEEGLTHRLILDFAEAPDGRIWIGTYGGINVYDGTQFKDFETQVIDQKIPVGNRVKSLAFDQNGLLWGGTLQGQLFTCHIENQLFTSINFPNVHGTTLAKKSINKIYCSPQNALYLVSGRAWEIAPTQIAIERLEKDSQTTLILPYGKLPHRLLHLAADANDNLWLVTSGGYYYLEVNTGELHPVYLHKGKGISIIDAQRQLWFPKWGQSKQLATYRLPSNLAADKWIHFVFDKNHNIWLKHQNGAVYRFDTQKEVLELIGDFPVYPDNIFRIFEDRNGLIWTSRSEGGFSLLTKTPKLFDHYLNAPPGLDGFRKSDISFYAIEEDSFGMVYAQNDLGEIFKINPSNQAVTALNITQKINIAGKKTSFSLRHFIKERRRNRFWLGTNQPYIIGYNPNNQQTELFRFPDSLAFLEPIVEDEQQRLWCRHNQGMVLFDMQTKTFQPLSSPIQSFRFASFDSLASTIWAVESNQLQKINTQTAQREIINLKTKEGVQLKLNHVVLAYRDFLWLGSSNGLIQYHPATQEVERFTTLDGLAHDKIYTIIPEHNYLWLGTYNGLSRMDLSTQTFKNFKRTDGLTHPQFNQYSSLKTKAGQLYFGCKNGINAFHPQQFKQTQKQFKLQWNEWSKYDLEQEQTIQEIIPANRTLILKPYEQLFTFRFALLNFTQASKNTYATYLENYDKTWQLPINQPFVQYKTLPPGDYQLHVKAFDHRGNPAANELTLSLTVLKVWYKRNWAITLGVISFLAMIFGLFYFQMKRNLEKEEMRQAKKLDAAKTKLYTNITHEFRTPLTVILGVEEELRETVDLSTTPRETLTKKLQLIRRNGQQLLYLVNQLLDLSKLEAQKMTVQLESGDIVLHTKYLLESLQSEAAAKQVQLHFSRDNDPIFLRYDAAKVGQIITNLLSNALKFTPADGHIYIAIATQKELEKTYLHFKIKDTGTGISTQQLPYIFDRFYQVDATLTRSQEGTGIGLALVKELVDFLKGTIEVESELGKGTTFLVRLPVTPVSSTEPTSFDLSPIFNTEQVDVKTSTFAEDRPTLLLIEDNQEVAQYIQSCLSNSYAIQYAENGQRGIDLALEGIPDFIISDIMMPLKDGYEVVETLKNDERTSHIPIILLTAKADLAAKLKGLEKGADAYLYKPFNKKELLIRIAQLMTLRKKLQARYTQLPSIPAPISKVHHPYAQEDQFLQSLFQQFEQNLSNADYTMQHLSEDLDKSRSHIYRKTKALTDKSPSLLFRSFRLQRGKALLKSSNQTVSEIAFQVGFSSVKYFSDAFLEEFGERPSRFRNS